jgi:hypothetical protein
MTRHRPILNRGRAIIDRYHVLDLPAVMALPSCLSGSAHRPLRPKVLNQLFLKHTAGLNEQAAIDRLVRHLIAFFLRVRPL